LYDPQTVVGGERLGLTMSEMQLPLWEIEAAKRGARRAYARLAPLLAVFSMP
jgi:hypothetical protein